MLDWKYIKIGFSLGLGLGLAALAFAAIAFLIQCLIVLGITLHAGQMGSVGVLVLVAFVAVAFLLLLVATVGKILGELMENKRSARQLAKQPTT